VPFLWPDDLVIDFSCGANDWIPLLKRMCLNDGFAIKGRAFDIISPKNMEDFDVTKSWFEVTTGESTDAEFGNML
jgi:hypothetical protein